MKHINILYLLFIALFTGACTSVQYSQLEELPSAKEDKALVFFYREAKFAGSAVSYYINEGDESEKNRIGALKNGTFFYVYEEPGTYEFWAKTEAKDSVTLDCKAGEVYYVKGAIDVGFFAGRPDLSIAHNLEGQSEIPKLKYATTAPTSAD
jgi:hypothetical protein